MRSSNAKRLRAPAKRALANAPGIELGRALSGVQSDGIAEALRAWEPEQVDIGRVLVAKGGNNLQGVSGKASAFPDDYTIGRRVAQPPPAPMVAEAIEEYLADPEEADRRTQRVCEPRPSGR